MEDLDQVMIAGQFGAHLPAESLIGTGILPKEVKDKLIYVGNSSKTGAYLALMSGKRNRRWKNWHIIWNIWNWEQRKDMSDCLQIA